MAKTKELSKERRAELRLWATEQLLDCPTETVEEQREQIETFLEWQPDVTISALHPLMREIASRLYEGDSPERAVGAAITARCRYAPK